MNAFLLPGGALRPVSASMRAVTMPLGMRSLSSGTPSSAGPMNFIQIGNAAVPPNSRRPNVLGWSKPTHAVATSPGLKPENMARLQWTGIVRVGVDCGVWGSLVFAGEGAQDLSKCLRRPLPKPVLW